MFLMVINPDKLTFSEYLKQLPPELILRTFLAEEEGKRRVVSSSMVEEIANKFSIEEEIKKRFFTLPLKEQIRCGWMYMMGRIGVNTTSVSAPFTDILVSSFLGYAAKRNEEIRIFGFSSFEKKLEFELVRTLAENSAEKINISPTSKYGLACVNDIAIVLSFVSRDLFVRKKNGRIGTNALQQIKKLIHVPHFYENRDIEIIVESIIEYCKSRELIEELDDRYVTSRTAISYWLKREPQEIMSEVKEFFIKEKIGYNIDLLLKVCDFSIGKWLKFPSILKEDEKNIRRAFILLDFVNIIEIKKYKGEIFFQKATVRPFSEIEKKSQIAMIMPDFSLLIREECYVNDLYIFSCFSKLTTFDQIYHGKIDKESVTNALADCFEAEAIQSLLNRYNTPSNVMLSIKEWIREFLRISLCKKGVLVVSDQKIGEQLTLCEELKPLIKELPATNIFIIKSGEEERIERILKDMGFDIRMPVINYWENEPTLSCVENGYLLEENTNWSLIVENIETKENTKTLIKGSKYSSELKKLELSEIIQVIDYAILTSQKLIFSYEGSSYIKKGLYTVIPLRCSKGTEPLLEGEVDRTGSRKQFYVRKIDSIGVI
ncbi:MAG: hypothetical protein N2053_00905 [Chitinispirillaceae bacterium]|nr:hypothetical protein [Chitinispirillaceae bacterium]